jgi:hypothetical protein
MPDMVFRDYNDGLVKLDRRVPGDGTKWYVARWYERNHRWSHDDATIEPSELCGEPLPDPAPPRMIAPE